MAGLVELTVRPARRRRHPGHRGARGPRDRRRRREADPRCDRPRWRCRAFAARSSCRWSATRSWARSRWPTLDPIDPGRTRPTPARDPGLAHRAGLGGAAAARGDPPAEPEPRNSTRQELARSELALREQTRILQSVLDCMGDGVVVADATARFLVFNPAAERILGHGRIDTPPAGVVAPLRDLPARSSHPLPRRRTCR